MPVLSLYLKNSVYAKLAYLALKRGVSVTALIQEAVTLLLEAADEVEARKQ